MDEMENEDWNEKGGRRVEVVEVVEGTYAVEMDEEDEENRVGTMFGLHPQQLKEVFKKKFKH